MNDTTLGRAFNAVRNFAEDALERVEKRWDQAMDAIHGRPIRDPTYDPELLVKLAAQREYKEERALHREYMAEQRKWDTHDAEQSKAEERSDAYVVANGWTRQDAEAMNTHLDAKAAREWERSEPSAESVRRAERMADATDPIHDERRERQADNTIRQEVEQARNPVFDRWTTGADYEKAPEAQQAQQKFVRERAQAAEQGWKPSEHPEDPHYHERFGSREPSLSREVVGGRQILPFVDGKENGTMDREVKAAKEHVREREQERWTRVEQIGRQAIDSDKARVTERQTSTTDADLATKAERQRPQTA